MKDSVDLTTNRDFLHKAKDEIKGYRFGVFMAFETLGTPIRNILYQDKFGVLNDDYYFQKDKGAILQGNSYVRLSKMACEQFGLGKYCDCCGEKLKPWNNQTLCSECEERVSGATDFHFIFRNIF